MVSSSKDPQRVIDSVSVASRRSVRNALLSAVPTSVEQRAMLVRSRGRPAARGVPVTLASRGSHTNIDKCASVYASVGRNTPVASKTSSYAPLLPQGLTAGQSMLATARSKPFKVNVEHEGVLHLEKASSRVSAAPSAPTNACSLRFLEDVALGVEALALGVQGDAGVEDVALGVDALALGAEGEAVVEDLALGVEALALGVEGDAASRALRFFGAMGNTRTAGRGVSRAPRSLRTLQH